MPDQINALRAWWDTLVGNSPSLGYYPNTKKTWLIVGNSMVTYVTKSLFFWAPPQF